MLRPLTLLKSTEIFRCLTWSKSTGMFSRYTSSKASDMIRTTYDSENRIWSGVKTKWDLNKEPSLAESLLNSLDKNEKRIAQICAKTNTKTTFGELRSLTISAAQFFRNLGCEKGDVFFFFTANTSEIPPISFAAICSGCPIASEAPSYKKAEILRIFSFIKPKFVFCDIEYYEMLKECLDITKIDAEFITLGGQNEHTIPVEKVFEIESSKSNFVPTKVDVTKDIAIISATSGSTGLPKAVPVTHANLLTRMSVLKSLYLPTDILLGYTNVFAISGVRFLMASTLHGGTRIVNQGKFTPESFLDIVEKFKVSFISMTMLPTFGVLNSPKMKDTDLSSIRIFRCGGSRTSHDVMQRMSEILGCERFCHSSAMTETVGIVAINLTHANNNCVGQLIGGIEAIVIDDDGKRLGVGESGELCLRYPFQFTHYLGDDPTMVNKRFNSEGFFYTGDIAYFDENADLFIIDRKKEQFKSLSDTVTPMEIQEFLEKVDGVYQSCVVAIPLSNQDNLPAAVIQRRENATCTEESIFNAVAETFAPHKQLRGGVYFVDKMPTTKSAKVARDVVTKLAIELYNKSNKAK